MSDDQTVRAVLIAGVLVVLPIAVDHRLKSRATAEKLARWQKGLFIVTRLRPVGIVFMLELIAYMIRCDGLDDLGHTAMSAEQFGAFQTGRDASVGGRATC